MSGSGIRAVAVALCAATPAPAWAHAFLESAVPAVGGTVAAAPAEVEINFTEGVEPAFSTITVQDAAGTTVSAGPAHATGNARLAVPLRTGLPPGTYRVEWHVIAVDAHRTEGSFRFTVRP